MSELTLDRSRLHTGPANGLSIMCLWAVIVGSSVGVGFLVTERLYWQAFLVASIPAAFVVVTFGAQTAHRLRNGTIQFGIVWALLVASTFVWRGRTTEELNANPLDSASLARVGLVAITGLIAFAWLTRTVRSPKSALSGGVAFLALYVVAGIISALGSPLPLQAFYRIGELTVGLLLVVLARTLFREHAGEILVRLAVVTAGAIVVVVWLEAIAMPSRAWQRPYFHTVFPYVLTGPVPSFASNTVGLFACVLAIWGLAHVRSSGQRLAWLSLAGGLVTLAATQYRTGIAAFVIAAVVVLYLRRRLLLVAFVLQAVVLAILLFGNGRSLVGGAEAALTRGQPAEEIRSLNSRVSYWSEAWTLAEQRPAFGWGLTVGGRLATAAAGDSSSSTVHGTWVEALVGTGIVGLVALALAPLIVLVQALRNRAHPLAITVVGLLVVLVVRSATGTTFELFSISFLLFAALAVAASDLARSPSSSSGLGRQ